MSSGNPCCRRTGQGQAGWCKLESLTKESFSSGTRTISLQRNCRSSFPAPKSVASAMALSGMWPQSTKETRNGGHRLHSSAKCVPSGFNISFHRWVACPWIDDTPSRAKRSKGRSPLCALLCDLCASWSRLLLVRSWVSQFLTQHSSDTTGHNL